MMKLILSFVLILGFLTSASANFPNHWWEKIDGKSKQIPSWEILPSQAEKGKTLILSKRNELGILSNFAPTPFIFEGKTYASLEGAWQSMKYPESKDDKRYGEDSLPFTRSEVEKMTGFEAKKAGSLASKLMKKHHINYVSYNGRQLSYRVNKKGAHYELVKEMMKQKLRQNIEVQKILRSTGQLILLPDHHAKGDFIPPAWKYYEIWMELRKNL